MSCSDDEFPDLCVLLGMPKACAPRSDSINLRRSPRKRATGKSDGAAVDDHKATSLAAASAQSRQSPAKRSSPTKANESTVLRADPVHSRLGTIPSLTRNTVNAPVSASSNNRSSPRHEPRPIGLLHVDSLLLPLSKLAMQDQLHTKSKKAAKGIKTGHVKQSGSRFVLSEARCNDDEEDSVPEEDDD